MNYIKSVYSGRVGRRNFVLGILLFIGIIGLFAILATSLIIIYPYSQSIVFVIAIVSYIAYIPLSFYNYSLFVRRLHDLNKSGWYVLLTLVPIINIYWLIVLYFKKGQDGENRYGLVNLNAKVISTTFKGTNNTPQSV